MHKFTYCIHYDIRYKNKHMINVLFHSHVALGDSVKAGLSTVPCVHIIFKEEQKVRGKTRKESKRELAFISLI